jgi:acetyl-CoA acetyltransferase
MTSPGQSFSQNLFGRRSARLAAALGCQLLTLGAVAIGAAVARTKLRPDDVKTVAMGNVAGRNQDEAGPTSAASLEHL